MSTTMIAPKRETFINTYQQFTGVQLSDSFVGHFFRLASMIGKSQIRTHNVIIAWDGPEVTITKRVYA